MTVTTSSKSLRTLTELTLLADIKPGFVPVPDLMSYATRLGALLKALFGLRRQSIEAEPSGYVGPLERLQSLHFVRWSILEGKKLLLGVSFDRAWEPYIRGIVDEAGPFLDVIFCHTKDYDGHATSDGYAKFSQWVRAHQVDVPFFYAGNPGLTVDDERFLAEYERRVRAGDDATDLVLPEPGAEAPKQEAPDIAQRRLRRATRALALIREFFPPGRDQDFFDHAVFSLLEGLVPRSAGESIDDALKALAAAAPDIAQPLAAMRQKVPGAALLEDDEEADDLSDDLQGNVRTGYRGMTHGCLALLRCDGRKAARKLLARLVAHVTTDACANEAKEAVNVALTRDGLRTLGVSEAELAVFPAEFLEGMEARAGLLGDVEAEHPSRWQLPRFDGDPVPLSSVDAVLSVQASPAKVGPNDHVFGAEHPLAPRLAALLEGLEGVSVLHVEPLLRRPQPPTEPFVREHFGFVDGISQPVPRARRADAPPSRDEVALGEVVLGYQDDHGERPPGSDGGLLRHGSFLVVRKLVQDVRAFHAFVATSGIPAERLYGALMGRKRDGAPLVGRGAKGDNDFDYSEAEANQKCPVASHVRRTNPRTPDRLSVHGRPMRTPRIVRRGFSFGPIDPEIEAPRGLVFMAYNASIANQFEVLQRWINGGNSTGDLSSHSDPVVSHAHPRVVTVPHDGKHVRLQKTKPFVTLAWGMYLFSPSRSALSELAARDETRDRELARVDEDELAARGHEIITKLELAHAVLGETAARAEWKLVLEDRGAREQGRAVWAAIRRRGGALRTPYGVLVGSADAVLDVLADDGRCSVRGYYERMEASVGPLYLGMDRCPVAHEGAGSQADQHYERVVQPGTYDASAEAPNRFMRGLTREDAFSATRQAALLTLAGLATLSPLVDLRYYAAGTARRVSEAWFGLPNADEQFREIFSVAAQSIFDPHPEPVVLAEAEKAREKLRTAEEKLLETNPPMLAALPGFDDEEKKRALVGGAQGFLVATVASFVGVAADWLESGRAARLSQWLRTAAPRGLTDPHQKPSAADLEDCVWLVRELYDALRRHPQPDILYRKAVVPKSVADGAVFVAPGDTLVVSLASAAAERPESIDILFGGADPRRADDPHPLHYCPGKEAAIGVMLALAVTLLQEHELRLEVPLSISFKA